MAFATTRKFAVLTALCIFAAVLSPSCSLHIQYADAAAFKMKTFSASSIKRAVSDELSDVCDFIDSGGRYSIAYNNGKKVVIKSFSKKLKVVKTVKLAKRFPYLADVIQDRHGYYYVAWGRHNVTKKSGKAAFGISKFSSKGKHIKTLKLKSAHAAGTNGEDCRIVDAPDGECDMHLSGQTLVCMYGLHPDDAYQTAIWKQEYTTTSVVAVNTATMKEADGYAGVSGMYWQEDSRVTELSGGGAAFAGMEPKYSKRFTLDIRGIAESDPVIISPFHMNGSAGNSWSWAQLAGIGEVSTGIALVGCAEPKLNKSTEKQRTQLFMQVIDRQGAQVLKGAKRTGTSVGEKVTDTGVKWLTSYKKGCVLNPVMSVIDSSRVLVMWEKWTAAENGVFEDSYYIIVSANGKVLKRATTLGKRRLNPEETLETKGGYAYWTDVRRKSWSAFDSKKSTATVYRLKIGSTPARNYAPSEVSITDVALASGAGTRTPTWKVSHEKSQLKTTGYQARYSLKKNMRNSKRKTVKGNKQFKLKNLKNARRAYVQVRAYRTVKGKRYYSDWSDPASFKYALKNGTWRWSYEI